MFRFAVGLGLEDWRDWSARAGSVAQNPQNEVFFGINDTDLEKFRNFVAKEFMSTQHRFTFYVQISRKSSAGKLVKLRYFGDKKFAKYVFPRHFALVWRRAPEVCRGACHMTLRLPVRFRHNRFRFAGVISEKVSWHDHSIHECLRH